MKKLTAALAAWEAAILKTEGCPIDKTSGSERIQRIQKSTKKKKLAAKERKERKKEK